jgi:OOP family OmpA-OmpF porin
MFSKIAIAATFALVSTVASAADAPTKFYAGADIGTTKAKGESDRESGYGVFGGYNFTEQLAIEAGYRRLVSDDAGHLDQLSISAIGTIPLSNGFSVYGRLGVNRLAVKFDGDSGHINRGVYGIGMGYSFTPAISARIELQKPMSDLTNLSAGVVFNF